MADNNNIKYVNTSAAIVKMTSGVPFSAAATASSMSDSSTDDDDCCFNDCRQSLGSTLRDNAGNTTETKIERMSDKQGIFSKAHQDTLIKRLTEYTYSSPTTTRSSQKAADRHSMTQTVKSSVARPGDNINQGHTHKASSMRGLDTNKGDSQTVSQRLDSNQAVSEVTPNDKENYSRASAAGVISRSLSTSRSFNNVQDNFDSSQRMPSATASRSAVAESLSSPITNQPKQTSEHLSTKVSKLIQHEQPTRLSQSLENSQESVLKQWQSGLAPSNSMSAISKTSHQHKVKAARVNPFNNGLLIDEDHFSDTYENYFRSGQHSPGSTRSSSASQGPDWQHDPSDVSFAELGLSEDHFSHPQGHFGLSRAEELELAIENCKELIRDTAPGSDKQKNLVLKLVQLKVKLQEVKEGPEPIPDNVKVILSHKMMLVSSRTSKYYCERCNGAIWGMLQVWYRCTECGFRCHEKCLQQILRTCAKAKVAENPTLITEICPKEVNGLAGQNYRCWECRLAISCKNGHSEPRLCDYTGHYYCELCHWNNSCVVPARVLHNWDFIPRKVCRASKQFLKLMQKKAVIRIQDINPLLFVYVDQLNEIKKLREEMMVMKKYILSCSDAMSAKLLLLLENRQHFVESSDWYSMQDLFDAEGDVLLPELVNIHSTWARHIKVDCQLCQGRGYCCELCDDKEVLFPFDSTAVVCAKCSSVLHRHCYAKASICPRCERRDKRKSKDTEGLS